MVCHDACREEDSEWEHDGRAEGDAGDAGPVRRAQHHLRHRARLDRQDQRGAGPAGAQRRPLPLRDRHWRGLKLKLLLYCVWIIMLKIKLELHAFFLEWIGESIFLFTHEKRIVMMHLPHVPELRINSCLILSIC